jgi:hypothetical protein
MSEKKPKIVLSGQVRLPEKLDREIDVEASLLGKYKYEVIALAWAAYGKSSRKPTENEENLSTGNSTESDKEGLRLVRHGPDVEDVSKEEMECIRWLLAILRADPKLAEWIKGNIFVFRGAALSAQRDSGIHTPEDRAPGAGARGSSQEIDEAIAQLERDRGQNVGRLEQVEGDEAIDRERKRRATRKTREGSGD